MGSHQEADVSFNPTMRTNSTAAKKHPGHHGRFPKDQDPHDRQPGPAQLGKSLQHQNKAFAPCISKACRCMEQTPFIHPAADEPFYSFSRLLT